MKAPFPWFGGKRRVAALVWPRFGNVPNYVEPFAGSLAVLLARPAHWPARNETVNDIDCHLANFWRAVRDHPEEVAAAANCPVNEADLHAKHQRLHEWVDELGGQDEWREQSHTDPEYCVPWVAGWWVWGLSAWIGDAWCRENTNRIMPELHASRGSVAIAHGDRQRPDLTQAKGIHSVAKRPTLKSGGAGVHAPNRQEVQVPTAGLPHMMPGHGVHADRARGSKSPPRQVPDISGDSGASGRGIFARYTRGNLTAYMCALSERLRRVRVCCGQWDRILGPSPTVHIGTTAVFLDPPYGVEDRETVYGHDCRKVAGEVLSWCLEHGEDKRLRIALCGYEGEHNDLEAEGWDKVAWKAHGGYSNRVESNKNKDRERIWFGPGCIEQSAGLFDGDGST